MEIKHSRYIVISLVLITFILCLSFSKIQSFSPQAEPCRDWELQLNRMNFLVLKTSSINLVRSLYLNKNQTAGLLKLARQLESVHPAIPVCTTYCTDDLKRISITYEKFIEILENDRQISDTLVNEVNNDRKKEADIIKRSLLAASQPGYQGESCLKCHAIPALFPTGNISGKETNPITAADRKEIDVAHVKGLFGEAGTELLWNLRFKVDSILNNEQRYTARNFRCSLVPQKDIADPGIFGQSFVTNEWIEFFRSARKLTDLQWNDYRDLYLIPLRDLIEAKLPGIKKKDKKRMIEQAENVIVNARKMDPIDFELQKENLCLKLGNTLSIDPLNGESTRNSDDRMFITAMLLLFPGSSGFYMKIEEKK